MLTRRGERWKRGGGGGGGCGCGCLGGCQAKVAEGYGLEQREVKGVEEKENVRWGERCG